MDAKLLSLRMDRQCLPAGAQESEYIALYRDTQPGENEYWHGFGEPPVLSFRAAFDDIAFNRGRQLERKLVKGRFAGGNLGWIMHEDMELFCALYRSPLPNPSLQQAQLLRLIETMGPMNIQQIKEETGLLVKQITPVLHRLQKAFLIYEDQYDGEWDRGWYRFGEMFPDVKVDRYTRTEALKILLQRFAYRLVWFDDAMARSFYRIPEKEIKKAAQALIAENIFVSQDSGYLLRSDAALLSTYQPRPLRSVYALHRNDFLYRAYEHSCKKMAADLTAGLAYDHEPLQYLLIDGEFHGACVGHFRYGPYDICDVVCDLTDARSRKSEILEALRAVNPGAVIQRFLGEEL